MSDKVQQENSQLANTQEVLDGQENTVPKTSATHHAEVLKAKAHNLNDKEKLSAYFTIAAAAFGLISDGCEFVSATYLL